MEIKYIIIYKPLQKGRIPEQNIHLAITMQEAVLRIRDPKSGAFLTPGSGIQDPD
jgi:hypothetical protein